MMEIYEGFIYDLRNVRPATVLDLHGELYEVVITTGDTQFILLREDEDAAKEEIIAMRRRLLLAEDDSKKAYELKSIVIAQLQDATKLATISAANLREAKMEVAEYEEEQTARSAD